jgi:hypothetical protein
VTVFLADTIPIPRRSIALRYRDGGIDSIDETHRAYDALHFPLMFPCGEDGWTIRLPYSNLIVHIEPDEQDPEQAHAEGRRGSISMREYYASILQVLSHASYITQNHHDNMIIICVQYA